MLKPGRRTKYYYHYLRRKLKKLKHATIGSSKPKPTFLLTEAQPKLDAIEQIRADLHAENIEVPGIVVAGAQSAGKSSLLESLSNINLPSGENITTRVPLILRLERDANVHERYAIISDTPDLVNSGQKVKHIENLPNKIIEYTNKMAGAGGSVYDKPIHVKVVSSDGPSMTLIDLPGITHLSMNDNQHDIHEATVKLVEKYIANDQMIILCVVPAVDDFANSEAIKLAKSVDPTGKRTLGVVTKVDLCKTDTKISEKLRGVGNNIKLELGFVAVRNRSPEDVMKGTSIPKLRELEKNFFETSSHFIGVDSQYWGIDTVIKRISELQMKSVDEFIPKMTTNLSQKMNELNAEYLKLAPEFGNDVQKVQHMLRIVISVVSEFKSLAKSIDDCMEDTKLHVSPRTYELYTKFAKTLRESQPDFESEEFAEKVKQAIDETKCIMLFNFMSHVAFNQLYIESHVKVYRIACETLVNDTHDYVREVLDVVINKQLHNKYPPLLNATKLVVHDYLENQKTLLLNVIDKLIESELFIFTQNVEYPIKVTAIDDKDPVAFLQKTLKVYSDIAIARFCDYVPMQCHLFFVIDVYKHLHEYVDLEKMSSHLVDDTDVVLRRNTTETTINRFKNALSVLKKLT